MGAALPVQRQATAHGPGRFQQGQPPGGPPKGQARPRDAGRGRGPSDSRQAARLRRGPEGFGDVVQPCAEAYIAAQDADGAMPSIGSSGRTRSRPMPVRCWATSTWRGRQVRMCSRCWSRSGRPRTRRRCGCAAGSSAFWIGPRRGLRPGENPARWRGHLEYMLPLSPRGARGRASSGTALRQSPAFMKALRKTDGRAGPPARSSSPS